MLASSARVQGALNCLLCINLTLDIFDLELKISGRIFDPLKAGVEILKSLLHVSNLLLLRLVVAEGVKLSSLSVVLLRLRHLVLNDLQVFVKVLDVNI